MLFKSNTYGKCNLEEALVHVANKISSSPESEWVLAIGTDSQNRGKYTKFCTVILLHEVGNGGVFFYNTHTEERIRVINSRMLEEARMSIDLAKEAIIIFDEMYLNEEFDYTAKNLSLEIHCDLGLNGKSSQSIPAALGWIAAEFGDLVTAKIKPNSTAASCIADTYTK